MVGNDLGRFAVLKEVKIVDPSIQDDFSVYELRRGHSKKYRGNHRSHTRGKGILAIMRSISKKLIR